ncbi:MAG: cation:proton antiporter subunit C [Actinomycetales bacterium]|nr:cation:proton antiporter subunit C [Actinomycetales bacterium]
MILALTIGFLVAGGTYLLLQRSLVRIAFGVGVLSHAVNLFLLTAGITAYRQEPLASRMDPAQAADPLPQAFVLTAIVITLAVTVFLLALAVIGRNDNTHRVPETGEEHDR